MWQINEDDLMHLKYMKSYGLDHERALILLINIRAMKIIPNSTQEHITELFQNSDKIMRYYAEEL